MSTTIQIRKRGSITIPKDLRKRHRLDENDPLVLVDLGEGFFVSPKPSVLPKLVSRIEKLRDKHHISLEELIQGVMREREEKT